MTFMEYLLAIEEMQTIQRAENGIKEVVVGYIGSDWKPPLKALDPQFLSDMSESVGEIERRKMNDLPEHLQWILRAENHRMATGEVMSVERYKQQHKE